MKKKALIVVVISTALIALNVIITLTICMAGSFFRNHDTRAELGERYDSDEVIKFSPDAVYVDNYQDKYNEIYNIHCEAAREIQFVVHENTAIAIAEAVIKEIYPDEDYEIVGLSYYPKALYYELENCWEVWLFKDVKSKSAICIYIDVESGAVKAIIPADEFSIHNSKNSD